MQVQEHASLDHLNTLRLPSTARWLAQPDTEAQLIGLLQQKQFEGVPRHVIGDGSNLLLRPQLDALVIRPAMRGVNVLEQDVDSVLVEVGASERWDPFVAHSIAQGWFGLENLSLIPGTVGAAPYQNIGAYGVELADTLVSVVAVNLQSAERHEFDRQQCRLGYRDSLFKSIEPRAWLITRVRLRLSRQPQLRLDYADLRQRFAALPPEQQTPQGVRDIVCGLRREKLPDPAALANVGSFFKNPVVDESTHARLREQFPGLISYPQARGGYKLAAGWLIQETGWKGKRLGKVGMHADQALVLVNHGGASFEDVAALEQAVKQDVMDTFSVALEREPVLMS